jgi:hypothetical protein
VRTISARRSILDAWIAAIIIAEAMVKAIMTIAIEIPPALQTIAGETFRNLSGMCRSLTGCMKPGMNINLSFRSEWRCALHHILVANFCLPFPCRRQTGMRDDCA